MPEPRPSPGPEAATLFQPSVMIEFRARHGAQLYFGEESPIRDVSGRSEASWGICDPNCDPWPRVR
jgi:hypothetical protein